MTKLARLARSPRDAKDIVDDPNRREVKLSIGSSGHDPTEPVHRLLVNILAMVAEVEANLIRGTDPQMHARRQSERPPAG